MLYASPGKEPFYDKFAFKRLRTRMAHFIHQNEMERKGYI
jgi:hypothetical protein